MNIAFFVISLQFPGGIERVTSSLANELKRRGHNIMIVDIWGSGKSYYDLDRGITEIPLFRKHFRMRERYFFKAIRLRKLLKNFKCDILITVDSYLFVLSFFAGIGLPNKNLVWEHFNCLVTWNSSSRTMIRKLCARMADVVVPLTERDAWHYKQLCKNSCMIRAIPNPNPFESPKVIGYKLREKTVLAVGRLSHQKGFDLLIKAWRKVASEKTGWKLQIVGSGEDDEKLYRLANGLNLRRSLEFIPATKEIESYYQTASFFVLSSRYEGFGIVLEEAMGFGLPCVAFDCKFGPREIVEDGKNGLLVEPENVTKLARQMLFLIRNEEVRAEYSANALEKARDFTMQKIIVKWENLFSSMLDLN